MTAAVRSLSPADDGKPIKELDALDYFGSFRDLFGSRPADEEPALTAMCIRTQLAGFNRIEPTALDGWPRSPTAAELAFISGIKTADSAPLSSAQARLTQTIRDGVSANTLRKVIGGGGELLELLRSGFFGILGLLLGPLFL